MAIVYTTTIKNARLAVVQTAIEADAGVGLLKLYTAADVLVATISLEDGQTPSGGVLALIDAAVEVAAVATGTITKATITDNSGDLVANGLTVGTTGTDVILDTNVVSSIGQIVRINTATITHG